MKIVFSPYYDGNCFAGNPAKKECVLGTKPVGIIGLLNELELRAGLTRGEVSPMRRAIEYCNAIQEVLNAKPAISPFYEESFKNDPLGVAQQLLAWRDALTMAGWNEKTTLPAGLSQDGSKRLSDLQEIEQHFNLVGLGERWQQLLAEAQKRRILPNGISIVVEMKWDLIHPVIKKVFEEINKMAPNTVVESESVKNFEYKPLEASKFELYEFPEQNDAYQWAALQNFENAVFVNEDNFTFNQVLKSVGEPLVGASAEGGAAELSQLLKLGISLFRSPVNISNLLDYLSIFRHPLDWEMRSALKYHISKVGGFGDKVEKDGSTTKLASIAPQKSALWGMWKKCKNEKVAVQDVQNFCKELLDWAKKAKNKAEVEKVMNPLTGTQICSQLSVLQEQIQNLQLILNNRTSDISNDELDKIVASICQGDAVQTDFARLGSCEMLKDIKGLACDTPIVVWMDCVNKPRPHYPYAFLNPKDIAELIASGLDIAKPELEMQVADFAEKLAVNRAEKIIVLMPKRKDGVRTEENLLITELKTLNKGLAISSPTLPVGEDVRMVDANSQKVEHQVSPSLFANITTQRTKPADEEKKKDASKFTPGPVGYQRDYESYSSLSELINQPFDYVFDYLYNMKDEEDGNLSQTEGNVAHGVISQMVKESKDAKGEVDTKKFLQLCKGADLESRLDKGIQENGAVLLQPENAMECQTFKNIFLRKSIPHLVEIIEDNDLEVVDSEKEFTTNLSCADGTTAFNFNAKIDFILKKKNEVTNEDEYYIFDFKWTRSANTRKEELENRKELQLALYQKILEADGKNVVMRGYYLLKQAALLTAYAGFVPSDKIEIIKQNSTADIFEQAVESYRERIMNLQGGYIEEGEEMPGTKFENTQFIGKYLKICQATAVVPASYFLDNNVTMKYTKTKTLASMNTAKKKTSYGKNSVLKGKIK